MNQIKFKTKGEDLAQALSLASLVRPAPVDTKGAAGYLFVVRGEKCYIYSEDEHQRSRVEISIFDVEGEGPFIYPAGQEHVFQCMDSWVELSSSEAEDGAFTVSYREEDGTGTSKPSFDPRSIQALDRDLESSKEGPTFPSALLKEAINLGKGFLADVNGSKGPEAFKCFQLFDASKEQWKAGNGHLFAANGLQAFYFYSPVLEDKAFNFHSNRVGLITSFLSKSKGDVTLRRSERSTYLLNPKQHVVGWVDPVHEHDKFNYYPHAADTHVLVFERDKFLRTMGIVRIELAKKNKARLMYDAEKMTIRLLGEDNGTKTDKVHYGVVPKGPEDGTEEMPIQGGAKSKTDNVAFNVNIEHFFELITPLKSRVVELRISAAKTGGFFLRTVENFFMDPTGKVVEPINGEEVYPCRVTRFTISMK